MRLTRLAPALAVICALFAAQAHGQPLSGTPRAGEMVWNTLYMRSTAAASVARQANWTTRGSCQTCAPSGFADSSVYRRAAATLTVYDTTRAIDARTIPWAPNYGNTPMAALTDSSSLPWFFLRIHEDSLSYQFTGGSAMDSARVAAEVSLDGINWFSCQGTPTQRFDTIFMTTGQDGLQSPTLIGVEASPGEDMAQFVFKCHPSTVVDNSRITNRSLCMYNGFIRFIVGMDGLGQYTVDLGTWTSP